MSDPHGTIVPSDRAVVASGFAVPLREFVLVHADARRDRRGAFECTGPRALIGPVLDAGLVSVLLDAADRLSQAVITPAVELVARSIQRPRCRLAGQVHG